MKPGDKVRFKGSRFNKWPDSGTEPFGTSEILIVVGPDKHGPILSTLVSYTQNGSTGVWGLSTAALEPISKLNLPNWW
jgi:hypothetical protein